ncbi:TolC family protein [Candidatus Latescibacterota bacterium]
MDSKNSACFKLTTATFLIVVFFSLLFIPQISAETLLSLDDAIEIALEQGYSMKSLRLSLIQAEENRLVAKYRFRTNANMVFNTPSWSERVTSIQVPNALPVYNSLGTMQVQGQMDIVQPLPTDGSLTFRSQLYQSDESNYFAETGESLERKDFLTSLSIRLSQPLFTYNRLKTGLRRAELNYDRTSMSVNRTKLNVIYDVTSSFFTLYRFTRELEINLETLKQKEQAYELARLKYESGLIPEVEALEMEVDLEEARAEQLSSKASLELQRDRFKQSLGLELDEDIGVKTDIMYEHFDIDLDKAIEEGLANRSEIKEQEIDLELNRISLTETDARNEIRADLSAYYDLTGRSDPVLPTSSTTNRLFNSSWDDLERRPGNRGVSLTFQIPVWDWGVNKAEVASARVNLRQAEIQLEEEKKTIINSIRDAVRQVQSAESSLEILEKRQEIAQRTYDISLERFNNGDITSQELANNSNRLSSSKMAFLGSYITYKLAVEDLKRKTLWDFENNQPVS